MRMFSSINGRLYFQPENLEDVKQLIITAKETNKIIVIQGARHSYPFSDEIAEDNPGNVYVLLTYLNKITSQDWHRGIFTVQAGCRIGYDPFDETGVSTLENSLVFQLDPVAPNGRRTVPPGWSLPDLGGITHQTIGGFIATGSAGGSIKYAFSDAIQSVRIFYYSSDQNRAQPVDEVFYRPDKGDGDNPFWAVGFANLGLLGFVVEIAFQCEPAYNVRGCETTTNQNQSKIDLTGWDNTAKINLYDFLNHPDYTRLLWWPQKQIDKVVIWEAKQERICDWQTYKPKPYESLPSINGSTKLANKVFGGIFHFLGNTLVKVRKFVLNFFDENAKKTVNEWFDKINIFILKIVLSIIAKNGKKDFDDAWWRALPMDNEYSDKFAPVKFTELWIPIDKQDIILEVLNEFYKAPENAGTFCSEIYMGAANDFWLSPSYGSHMVRVDIFWFGRNFGDPEKYFNNFWEHFNKLKISFRCHWGKYLALMSKQENRDLLKHQYPRWSQFMALRKKHDPHGIFLNEYWQKHLDLN